MVLMVRLKTVHFAMFAYHEFKSGDTELAWHHLGLTLASRYKMAVLPPYNAAREDQNIAVIKSILVHGFWPTRSGWSWKHIGKKHRYCWLSEKWIYASGENP